MQSAGVLGLGLTASASVPATAEDDDENSANDEGEETSNGDGRTEIDSCTVIDEPGEYELVTDLAPDSLDQPACIVVDSDDVTLYGNDHTIDVSETAGDTWQRPSCITIHPGGPYSEVDWDATVEDVELRGGAAGIESIFNFNQDMTFTNVTAVGNGYGFRFDMSGGTLNNCVIEGNDTGFRLEGDTHVYGQATDVTLQNTTVRSNSSFGLDLREFAFMDVTASRVVDNGVGVRVSAAAGEMEAGATLEDSHICGNEHYGVDAGATRGPGGDAGPGEEPGPWEADVDATRCYWGAANGPSSFGNPEEPFTDPETGRPADGDGDAISQSLEPGVSNVRFDPFQESTIDGVGADR